MENNFMNNNKERLTHLEQYVISLLLAGFIYGSTYFCITYLIKVINPYFEFSQDIIRIALEMKELFLLDRNLKYLIPIIIYLFFFGLSMQTLYGLTNQKD